MDIPVEVLGIVCGVIGGLIVSVWYTGIRHDAVSRVLLGTNFGVISGWVGYDFIKAGTTGLVVMAAVTIIGLVYGVIVSIIV